MFKFGPLTNRTIGRCAVWSFLLMPRSLPYPLPADKESPPAPRPRPLCGLVARSRFRVPWSAPVVRSRCGRARCPHRAAAPRRGARLGIPHPLPAPPPAPFVRSRCGRARCPHRAAAPHGAVRGLASHAPRPRPSPAPPPRLQRGLQLHISISESRFSRREESIPTFRLPENIPF